MITFVGGSPFSTSFASRHSWRVRQSEHDNYDDYRNIDDDNDNIFDDFEDDCDNFGEKADNSVHGKCMGKTLKTKMSFEKFDICDG